MPALLGAALVALAGITGCGSGPPPSGAPAATVSAPSRSSAGMPALTGTPTDLSAPSQAQAGAGPPPIELVTQDVDRVDVRYTGTFFTDGAVFDSSWSQGAAPATFPLSRVVPGVSPRASRGCSRAAGG